MSAEGDAWREYVKRTLLVALWFLVALAIILTLFLWAWTVAIDKFKTDSCRQASCTVDNRQHLVHTASCGVRLQRASTSGRLVVASGQQTSAQQRKGGAYDRGFHAEV